MLTQTFCKSVESSGLSVLGFNLQIKVATELDMLRIRYISVRDIISEAMLSSYSKAAPANATMIAIALNHQATQQLLQFKSSA